MYGIQEVLSFKHIVYLNESILKYIIYIMMIVSQLSISFMF